MKMYEQYALTRIEDSNVNNKYQAWQIIDDGAAIRDFIAPTDVLDATGSPALGYTVKLYKGDGTEIDGTDGNWVFDYYSGLVLFEKGKEP